jgi:hypothetical protein
MRLCKELPKTWNFGSRRLPSWIQRYIWLLLLGLFPFRPQLEPRGGAVGLRGARRQRHGGTPCGTWAAYGTPCVSACSVAPSRAVPEISPNGFCAIFSYCAQCACRTRTRIHSTSHLSPRVGTCHHYGSLLAPASSAVFSCRIWSAKFTIAPL